jgi:small subunit ribosomal protein S3
MLARFIGDQLEKRLPFRKVIRQITKTSFYGSGFKIQISGRLNGAEIARSEWFREGRVPLQTIQSDINYASHRASTIYGILGIKVWLLD